MAKKDKDNIYIPKYIEHKLDHCQQCFSWDCGIACVKMVLSSEQRDYMNKNFTKICQDEGFQQLTWTIDLCYLLKRFGIGHCLYTMVKGVNTRQADVSRKTCKELKRIERRFSNADNAGITIKEKELSIFEVILHVVKIAPAIVLVDSTLLVCDLCKHNKLRSELRRAFGGPYQGHYVIIVGCSGGKILYRDPALNSRLCAISPARLHAARRVTGTDFDVILIYK